MAAVGFGVGQALLQLLQLVRHAQRSAQSLWLSLLLLSALAYFLQAIVPGLVFAFLANLLPGLMWMFCCSVFDDYHRTQPWQLILIGFSAAAPIAAKIWPELGHSLWPLFLQQLPQLLEFVFLLFALVIIARSWRDDLVQARRRLRVGFCGFLVFFVLLLIFTREVIDPQASWFPASQYAISAIVLLLSNALLLRFGGGIWGDIAVHRVNTPELPAESSATSQTGDKTKPASGTAAMEQDPVLLKGLAELMQKDAVYRETGLGIGQLAARLNVPEYRLRQAINHGLGYRNFNDFMNRYRVQEAAERMISEKEKATPILSIALDVGFKSISSFNKAFKERYDVTPSVYRSEAAKTGDNCV